ncbi:MAG: NAD-binding protein [Desulfococcaceae bacterium]|jgi:Trk K+ transport system NAD-binding subunit/nucleotide-binding universal stress UspA family protein|nr:NAD-binding protein [Desulfococcaceae bacterium]
MNVVICGAGRYTRHLLGRLGERWRLTLVDISEEFLTNLAHKYPTVVKILTGDASSPLILENAGADTADYILALTDNDKVNLAVAAFAREKNVPHILSLVHDYEYEKKFRELGVYTIFPGNMVGGFLYHYLQDPRIHVLPVAQGYGEMVEFEVTRDNWVIGMPLNVLSSPDWRMAAIFREGEMILPEEDSILEEGDRVILLGKSNFFRSVCSVLACAYMPFPMSWGRNALIVLNSSKEEEIRQHLEESMYLVHNSHIHEVILLSHEDDPDPGPFAEKWNGRCEIRLLRTEKKPAQEIAAVCRNENIGIVFVRPLEKSFLKSLTRPETISLAHGLPCPMLITRKTFPFEKILVPFNATPMSERALETAMDLAEIFDADVDAVVVEEPEFIHNRGETSTENLFKKVRELSHIHKIRIGEILREGNPVKELSEMSADYQLMVVGSTSVEKEFLTPHVGELLTERAVCSVLVIAEEK